MNVKPISAMGALEHLYWAICIGLSSIMYGTEGHDGLDLLITCVGLTVVMLCFKKRVELAFCAGVDVLLERTRSEFIVAKRDSKRRFIRG